MRVNFLSRVRKIRIETIRYCYWNSNVLMMRKLAIWHLFESILSDYNDTEIRTVPSNL